jgi:hypothetical protein
MKNFGEKMGKPEQNKVQERKKKLAHTQNLNMILRNFTCNGKHIKNTFCLNDIGFPKMCCRCKEIKHST